MRLHLAAMLMLMTPAAAMAADCSAYSVDGLLAPVGYFTESMQPVALGENGSITFVHRDDPGIGATFTLVATASDAGSTRSEYIGWLESELARRSGEIAAGGATPQSAVHPYDPISSSIRSTFTDGRIVGETDMRLSATCHLNVDWHASESAALLSRTMSFLAAIDAVRTLSSSVVEKSSFVEELRIPTGVAPLLTGFLAPILAAALLFMVHMASSKTAAPTASRVLVGGTVLVTATAIAAGVGQYGSGVPTLTYLDSLLLLLALGIGGATAAATGQRHAVAFAAALSMTGGLSIAVSSYFGWMPNQVVGAAVAVLLTLIGAGTLAVWQYAPFLRASGRRRRVA